MMRAKTKAPRIALARVAPGLCPLTHQITAHLVPPRVVKIAALAQKAAKTAVVMSIVAPRKTK